MTRLPLALVLCLILSPLGLADEAKPLPGTKPLTEKGDFSALMLDGMEKFLLERTKESVKDRQAFWKRDLSSREAYERSVEPNRQRLRAAIGAVDELRRVWQLEYVSGTTTPTPKRWHSSRRAGTYEGSSIRGTAQR